mmetsp:Transcript_16558/g.28955  ORF Transcript_16558/g.28955 Transcript_16558/m.28955 type:complete len:258 (+) Transcript_16558:457-1230(+)
MPSIGGIPGKAIMPGGNGIPGGRSGMPGGAPGGPRGGRMPGGPMPGGPMPGGPKPGIMPGGPIPGGGDGSPMAWSPICMPSCIPIPRMPVACGHSFVRWSPPHVAQTHVTVPEPAMGLEPFPKPFLQSCRLAFLAFSSFSESLGASESLAFLPSSSLASGSFKIPFSPRAQTTSFKMCFNASSCCSLVPMILISRSLEPAAISSAFWTLMSADDFSITSRTVSPPRPITRPASRSLTQTLIGGGRSASPSALCPGRG